MDQVRPEQIRLATQAGDAIDVRLKINARAKRINLKIDPVLGVVLTLPDWARLTDGVAFAQDRIGWIEPRLAKAPKAVALDVGDRFPFRGVVTEIDHQPTGRGAILDPGPPQRLILRGGRPDRAQSRVIAFCKAAAKADLSGLAQKHAERLDVSLSAISVRDTRSRWGSCTVDGRLSFSWRLILAPDFVRDYVAAHEVAHRLEMNHSRTFWAHVERLVGDYRPAQAWLKRHGGGLHVIGRSP